ncbi:MAG: HAMP domain-containing sensor histidine kinase, partial [Bacteroidota bacterium]
QEVRKALDHALYFYDIHFPYDIEIFDERETCASPNSPSCCSLGSVAGYDDQVLHITFPNRTQYFLGEMSFMIGAAILILLFVSTVFGLATYYLIQQQKIGERNKDFFNNMAHEFKTPLTNIILANNLLAKKQPQLKQNNFVNITQKEANKLMHQVERVLYLANMERSDYALKKEPFQVAVLLAEVVEGMAMQIAEKQAAIAIDIPEDLTVQGDKFHLSNAFRNLIENALKYANQTPRIDISATMKDNGVLLLFKDNGIGIAKSEQAIVFDKFQRVGTGDVHNEKGFGLGLAYVKKVVELHQGFIRIFSELHQGSRFDLYLPNG